MKEKNYKWKKGDIGVCIRDFKFKETYNTKHGYTKGDICKNFKDSNTGFCYEEFLKSNDRFRPATKKEILAYNYGIRNLKDIPRIGIDPENWILDITKLKEDELVIFKEWFSNFRHKNTYFYSLNYYGFNSNQIICRDNIKTCLTPLITYSEWFTLIKNNPFSFSSISNPLASTTTVINNNTNTNTVDFVDEDGNSIEIDLTKKQNNFHLTWINSEEDLFPIIKPKK